MEKKAAAACPGNAQNCDSPAAPGAGPASDAPATASPAAGAAASGTPASATSPETPVGGKPADKQVANEPPAAAAEPPGKPATKPKNEAPSAPAAQPNSSAASTSDTAPTPPGKAKDKPAAAEKSNGQASAPAPNKAPAANAAPASQAPKARKDAKDKSAAPPPAAGRTPARDETKKPDAPKPDAPKPDAPKQGGHIPVNVCHATSSDSNPYVFITVDDDSVKAEGHLAHKMDPNKTWKSAGTYLGSPHVAGQAKPDLIGSYVNADGKLVYGDGPINSLADCHGPVPPPPPPPPVVAPTGSFTTICTPAAGVTATIGTLTTGSVTPGSFRLVGTGFSQPVESGRTLTVPPEMTLTLEYVTSAGAQVIQPSKKSPAACPALVPPPKGDLSKTSVPPSGSVVTAGQVIDYTVTVTNTGQEPITNAPVVDTLPNFVTVVAGSVSGDGVVTGGRTITWTVNLTAAGTVDATKTFTYRGLVTADASGQLVNRVTFLGLERTTTHTVGANSLEVRKSVSAAVAKFGDTLTYGLTVKALGTLGQTMVVVRDSIPAGTTYVSGSAACDRSPCMEDFENNEVSWELGDMGAGTTRAVTFQVTIDKPTTTAAEGIPGVTIRNVGLAFSKQVPPTPSNEVVTDVVAVGGVKTGPKGPGGSDGPGSGPEEGPNTDDDVSVAPTSSGPLARTGGGLPFGAVLLFGGLLLLGGIALLRVGLPARSRGVS